MTNVFDLFKLNGKVAIVTGGAAGIGIDMCHALAEAGANVVVVGRGRHGDVDEMAKIISDEHKVESIAVKCNVGDLEAVKNMVAQTKEKFGKIDILLNNAGITWGTPSEKMALADWEKVIRVNLTGAFLCSQQVAAQDMIPRKQGGVILNTSSIWSIRGTDWGAVGYAASKAGLNGLTRQLAIEWAKYKIRVNAICLSMFPSGMSNFFIDNFGKVIKKATPLKRIGEPDDFKGLVVALISKAGAFVTGQTLVIDGGTSMAMKMT
ncbi:MAG: SDR family oxidoreductase [Candidatus Helarchaeota archaeon]